MIATARAEILPSYLLVAGDFGSTPVTATDATPYPKPASGPDTRQGRPGNHRSGFKPHDPWPCSPPTPFRGSSSNEAYSALIEAAPAAPSAVSADGEGRHSPRRTRQFAGM